LATSLLSGGIAGTVASCLTNPLEVIKTQLQSTNAALQGGQGHPIATARMIMKRDGIPGFFRGLPPLLVGIIPSRSAYFYAYQKCKTALGPIAPEGSPVNALTSGLVAGLVGNTITNPIWMVRTRMQVLADTSVGQKAYTGYEDAIATIYRQEGIPGFYRGVLASYWGCLEGATQFLLYEQFKSHLLKRENTKRATEGLSPVSHLSKATTFASAAVAKLLASMATYPHEVARTRLREQARAGVFKYKGMWQTLFVIAREEGRQGLYAGMTVHLTKAVPNSAFMFVTYEVVRRWLHEYQVVDG
jgi:solute carrier family 25, member 33/36